MVTFKQFLQESETYRIGGNNAALEEFMRDYYTHTTGHPFTNRLRIHNDAVMLEISKFGDAIHISSIMTAAPKNQGHGTTALKFLTDLADKHQVKLEGTVVPIKNAGSKEGKDLTKRELLTWYKKHGFTVKHGEHITRLPKPKS
jgi:hypothetical protein